METYRLDLTAAHARRWQQSAAHPQSRIIESISDAMRICEIEQAATLNVYCGTSSEDRTLDATAVTVMCETWGDARGMYGYLKSQDVHDVSLDHVEPRVWIRVRRL